jgi:ATP-dependent exoDNAse (exonuclease V) beta subunit
LNDSKDAELMRERAEGERIAYVAATRARDLLVVPAVGDGPYTDGWIAPLNAAIYPVEDVRRQQMPGAGCPAFKSRDTVLMRPDGDPASFLTVCPGQHQIGDEVSVVWWAPDALALGAQAPFGLRRDDLIVKDVAGATLRQHLATYETWRDARKAAIAAAAVPSINVLTATEWAMSGTGDEHSRIAAVAVTSESVASTGTAPRPGGTRFGTLVHAVLADMPLDGDEPLVTRLVDMHGRVLGASAEEIEAAADTCRRVFGHPLLREAARAAEAGQCYRETPVTWRLADTTIVEGNVDLAFLAGEQVVVVDFKTDRELGDDLEKYQRQVQIYAAAIGTALGKSARAVLMRV